MSLTAAHGDPPNLGAPRAGGEEVDGRSVRGPAGVELSGRMCREPAEPRSVHPHHPEVGTTPVRLLVQAAEAEDHPLAVRGHLWVGDPIHLPQVLGVEGVGFLSVARRLATPDGQEPGTPEHQNPSDPGHYLRFRFTSIFVSQDP